MMPVFVNGRFLTQRMTGVQRYASRLLAALDARLAAEPPAAPWTLLLPPGATAPALEAIAARPLRWHAPGGTHGWEQAALPWAARRGLLLSLAGGAPALLDRQACVMHDAAVFDCPEAYTPGFRTWYCWLFRRLARRAALPITVSAFSRARLARATGVPAERFALVPGGTSPLPAAPGSPEMRTRLGLASQRYLLAVASRNPTKNLPALLRAWAGLRRSDARLVLVGAANRQVFAATDLPAAQSVLALGAVDDATLRALYEGAAGLVVPSLYEGFGLPPLEAMALGCPVAAARVASLPEVCGDAALWFDPHDERAIAVALGRLLDDAALVATLRERGPVQAARWSWDAAAAALLQALAAWNVARVAR